MTRYVVKLGGHALDALDASAVVLRALAEDVNELRRESMEVALVHGGGPQIENLLAAVGHDSSFLDGLRVTDDATMKYVAMALGAVNTQLVATLNHLGLHCAGVSGTDATTFRASPLGGPWGRSGGTPEVDASLLEALWRAGVTPVVSPIAVDSTGDLVNCNADTVAGALAGSVGALCLVMLSDVDQLLEDAQDEKSALDVVSALRVRQLLDDGAARGGMRPKLRAALTALEGGASRVTVANGTRPHALRDVVRGRAKSTEVRR